MSKTLTALSAASALGATDLFPVTQGGNSRKATVAQLATALLGASGLTGATVTANTPLINLTQTWNNGAVEFDGIKLNITDTASDAVSRLLLLQTGGVGRFEVTKAGNVYASGSLNTVATGFLGVSNRHVMRSPSTGVLTLLNWNENDYDRLQFGGVSASFPALKRSTTGLQVRLADDSAFGWLQGQIRSHANLTVEAPGAATRTIRMYDAEGTEVKVLCVAP